MQALFEIILPVFLIVGFGYFVTWRGIFKESAVEGLVTFTQGFAIPCLLFREISRIELGAITNTPLIVAFYCGALTCFVIGVLCAKTLFKRTPVDAVAIGFCCLFSNTVLLGLPITERAYGMDALAGNLAIITFHAPVLYLLGIAAMEFVSDEGTGIGTKVLRVLHAIFRNPLVIAITLGLIANVTSMPIPKSLLNSIGLIADAALPAALFGLGGVIFQYRPEGDLKTIIVVCVISLVIHPAIAFFLGTMLNLDAASMRSGVITASMTPGVNVYVFANMYGAARRVAASSVLIATGASVITIWFWLLLLP